MSEVKNDGGPAFPFAVPTDFQFAENGMSLRDWFAGQAINGIISCAPMRSGVTYKQVAEGAYLWADAMLVARDTLKEQDDD